MSILLVEDDVGVSESVSGLLRDEGYEVDVARDGAAALDRLSAGPPPSLIVLDLMMPGMDGQSFRERQLEDPALAGIPLIVISARPDGKRVALELGADDYLAKPMSFEELLHVVQNRAITAVHDPD